MEPLTAKRTSLDLSWHPAASRKRRTQVGTAAQSGFDCIQLPVAKTLKSWQRWPPIFCCMCGLHNEGMLPCRRLGACRWKFSGKYVTCGWPLRLSTAEHTASRILNQKTLFPFWSGFDTNGYVLLHLQSKKMMVLTGTNSFTGHNNCHLKIFFFSFCLCTEKGEYSYLKNL